MDVQVAKAVRVLEGGRQGEPVPLHADVALARARAVAAGLAFLRVISSFDS